MKKFLIILVLSLSCVLPLLAGPISEDKTGFAEISTVIDDAVYDIRIFHQTILRATK